MCYARSGTFGSSYTQQNGASPGDNDNNPNYHGNIGDDVVQVFEVVNDDDDDDDDDYSEDEVQDEERAPEDFSAYEWMGNTDLEEFDKQAELEYWSEVINEAKESQAKWDHAYQSCPESDLPALMPEYVAETTHNLNLIRLAEEEKKD